jgi:hypothetical protein
VNGRTLINLQSEFNAGHDERLSAVGLGLLMKHQETLRRAMILVLLYLIPAFLILQPIITDPDIWWHLETGKWIADHRTLPTTDPFSTYGEGKSWIVYSWLFEVSMYGLVRELGVSGVVFYTLVGTWLIMFTLHLIIARRCRDFITVSSFLAISVGCLSKLFTPRPWLFTILFCAITLEVVLSLREEKIRPWFWCLPLIYMLWANIHIQFVYGLSLLGLAIIAPVIDRYLQPSIMMWGSLMWRRLVVLTVLCVASTLVTPYGGRLYLEVLLYAGQTGFWDIVQEMQAPSFRSVADWSMLVLFSLALVQLGRRKTYSSFEVLFLLAASVSFFRGQRDIWFLVLAALTVLVPIRIREGRERILSHKPLAPIFVIIVVSVVCILEYRGFSEVQILQNTAKMYPIDAANFIERHRYRGPLFNHFDWGGYLIWRLPFLKVSMDGRGNVHGDTRIKQSILTWNGSSNWRDNGDLEVAEVVIVQKDMALASLLQLDPDFRMVYKDDTAIVFESVSQSVGSYSPVLEFSVGQNVVTNARN